MKINYTVMLDLKHTQSLFFVLQQCRRFDVMVNKQYNQPVTNDGPHISTSVCSVGYIVFHFQFVHGQK